MVTQSFYVARNWDNGLGLKTRGCKLKEILIQNKLQLLM